MHCKGYLITDKKPNQDEIEDILKDYYYENEDNESGFTWDWWTIGGRYCEDEIDESFKYEDSKEFDITECYVVIAENYINIRERWDGNHFIKNENFDKEVKQIDLKGKIITIIDFHD